MLKLNVQAEHVCPTSVQQLLQHLESDCSIPAFGKLCKRCQTCNISRPIVGNWERVLATSPCESRTYSVVCDSWNSENIKVQGELIG